uniref:Reelin domain-containing protein n=1 Tax=Ascaris lumbricoides TaxID=6252 RepID=A0A0M3I124_ASCLU
MLFEVISLLIVAFLSEVIVAWPDGSPCIHSAFESMNPLEAVEHQGGLRLTNPPYTIDVLQKCYWRNQPIEQDSQFNRSFIEALIKKKFHEMCAFFTIMLNICLKLISSDNFLLVTLRGNTTDDKFRGFAIQPIVYRGPHQGKRVGQFLRLDDNGSWQQQCFRFKDSVTHSHDEKKKRLKLWWKNDLNEEDTVQFVATVVKAQKEFWVKSVLSVPIPPCQLSPDGITDYVPPPVTPPPPVRPFLRSNEFS